MKSKAQMQDDLISDMERQLDRPLVLSQSNFDFIEGFLNPRPMPDFVKRNGCPIKGL